MEGLIRDIPWCIGYSSEKFGLVSLEILKMETDISSKQMYSYTKLKGGK